MVLRARFLSLASPPLLRLLLAGTSISAAVVPLALATPAAAQPAIGDADRAAARDLFVEGVKLQDQGKYKDALDRFQRAQAVLNAPTHLLHIGQCQASLGHLVEAAEAYRLLARAQLAATAPKPFLAAQQQGATELAQLEPRIPSLKLVVKPENAAGLTLQIDGQPTSAALVGVARPSNPGEHTFTVSATGYAQREQRATVREREQKEVTVTLEPGGDALPPPIPVAAPVVAANPAEAPAAGPPPPPAEYQATPEGVTPPPPPSSRRTNSWSFLVGPRIGASIGAGDLGTSAAANNATSVSDLASPGLGVGLEAGFRFARVLYAGLVFDHGVYGKGGAITTYAANNTGADANFVTKTYSNYFGASFAWISHPDGVGFYGEVGLGYRWFNADVRYEIADGSGVFEESLQQWRGYEGSLGVGVHVKIGDYFRLIPKATVSLGSFGDSDVSCTTNSVLGCANTGLPNGTQTETLNQSSLHAFMTFGVVGFFDIGRHDQE